VLSNGGRGGGQESTERHLHETGGGDLGLQVGGLQRGGGGVVVVPQVQAGLPADLQGDERGAGGGQVGVQGQQGPGLDDLVGMGQQLRGGGHLHREIRPFPA